MIKVFSDGKQVATFPMLMRNLVDKKKDRFLKLGAPSLVISKLIDSNLERIGVFKVGDISNSCAPLLKNMTMEMSVIYVLTRFTRIQQKNLV
jgi:hypothetical protein